MKKKKNLFDTSIFRGKGGKVKVELVTETSPLVAAIVKAATQRKD